MADMRDGSAPAPAAATGAPPPAATPARETAKIAGFWRRLFALFIDGVLLAIVGMVIGAAAYPQLVEMGQSGRLIGAAITLVYYGFLNSGWGGGATFGKRMLGLRVVRRDGHTIGLFRSLVRTVVFWTPFYLNGVYFASLRIPGLPNDPRIGIALAIADAIVVFGGMFLIIYLYVFNRRTRQTLHDLIAGTFVVREASVDIPIAARFWKGHLAIAGVAFALVLVLPLGLSSYFWGSSFQNSNKLLDAVLARPGVASAQIATNTMVGQSFGTGKPTSFASTTLNVVVQARGIPISTTAMENDIAATVLQMDPRILGQQNLSVKVTYGYELGIWSWSTGDQFTGTPQDWSKRLRDAKPTTSA
jgi:uncharacterized RDD family membrane protein YckC